MVLFCKKGLDLAEISENMYFAHHCDILGDFLLGNADRVQEKLDILAETAPYIAQRLLKTG